ncbi:ArgP/LysG family DNA-binding transcriptional regulator [Amycolatopsis sp. A1MSW2902]|uniref:ArgP/LysG family DNA-binding transcriptional regulator n=1 Tax=Amycolatopsis sp. A1MSW2902 TaxID=687413 RepID=UPI00307F129F
MEALEAVDRLGSFTAAAAELHLTPGALSQRIQSLEAELGGPAVVRKQPASLTKTGAIVLGVARRVLLAEEEAETQLRALHGGPPNRVSIGIAINADSLSTWFRPVIQRIANEGRWLIDLHIQDQDWSVVLLREARVAAAVTTDPTPPQGCRAEPLGVIRYIPVASRTLLKRAPITVPADLVAVPTLRFDHRDALIAALLGQFGIREEPPTHYVPSNHEYLDAVYDGLGWSVLPEAQIAEQPYQSELVRIMRPHVVEVPLYWHRWSTPSETLDDLTDMVRHAARQLSQSPRNTETGDAGDR